MHPFPESKNGLEVSGSIHSRVSWHAAICAFALLLTSEACVLQVLWQALKSGGIYVVEDLSENYIEKPFLDKGTFTNFMKTAIDTVQCRCLPPPCPSLLISQTQTHPP